MQHTACGRTAYEERRKSAFERLEKHLSSHKSCHAEMAEEDFKGHDSRQKSEYGHIGDLISGKVSKAGSKKTAEVQYN